MIQVFSDTVEYWKAWLHKSTYRGRWREAVARSAMTLKLMTYAPTGALVAAPTAGLPEQVGGERNWDYRFTWVRDASFSVYALLGLGYTEEAAAFGVWLRNTMEQDVAAGESLHLMYRVDGSSDLKEESLDHFEGYEGSAPVRIGNGAADQLQLDIYGEAMDSIRFVDRSGARVADRGWNDIVHMIDWLCDHWDEPDEGIWETRGGRKGFTYSRLMEWVAFDRAIRMALDHGLPADIERWRKERDQVYRWIQTRGWNDIVHMIDWLCDHWDEPDEGIWETRGGRKGFTYSRLMEWVAFDRAIRMALDHGLPADIERWRKERDQVYRWIQTKGWNDS